MAQRPSEPLLSFLREAIRKKGLSTSELAGRIGRERGEIRRALTGAEPLSVDDLVLISQALNLTPAELGLAPSGAAPLGADSDDGGSPPPPEEEEDSADEEMEDPPPLRLRVAPARPASPPADTREPSRPRERDGELTAPPDPAGNLPEQVLRLGFALGIDLFILFDATQLAKSGVPHDVMARFKDQLPIKLEARYHRPNRPIFGPDAFGCTLSFDRLYTCTFPWTAFRQITFHMPTEGAAPAPLPPEPEPAKRPTLRLVK